MKALLTRKIGMTSLVDDDGKLFAVTLLSAKPNVITRIKSEESDGYQAVQIGFEEAKSKKKDAKPTPKVMREIRIIKDQDFDKQIGDQLAADSFEIGDVIDATGLSKGKGWAGTIKRHNFHRGRKTHGGRSYRRPGSIGSMYPQRIFPGKKMAGQMGHERVTTKKLKVALIDNELNVIAVTGAVPGPRKGLVLIQGAK